MADTIWNGVDEYWVIRCKVCDTVQSGYDDSIGLMWHKDCFTIGIPKSGGRKGIRPKVDRWLPKLGTLLVFDDD